MGFITRLRTDAWVPPETGIVKDDEFVVVLPLVYHSEKTGMLLEVLRGYITDFASVPRIVREMPGLGVNGRSRAPAVLHDFLYSMQGKVDVVYTIESDDHDRTKGKEHRMFSRKECDDLFLEALESVQCWTRHALYAGVRAGGWAYWDERQGTGTEDDFVPDSFFEDTRVTLRT